MQFPETNINNLQSFKRKRINKFPSFKKPFRFLLTSWRRKFLMLVIVLILLTIFSGTLNNWLIEIRDTGIRYFGIGIIPIAIFFLIFLFAAIFKWNLILRNLTIWAGCILLLSSLIGILAYWRATSGIFYDSTLGGTLGYTLRGSDQYLGLIRIIPLTIAGVWIAFPKKTPGVILSTIRLLAKILKRTMALFIDLSKFGKLTVVSSYTYFALIFLYTKKITQGLIKKLSSSPNRISTSNPIMAESSVSQIENYIDEEEIPEIYADDDLIDTQPSGDADKELTNEWGSQLKLSSIESEKTTVYYTDPSTIEEKPKIDKIPYKKPWKMPPIDMLWDAPENSVSEEDQRTTAGTIVRTLGEYGIEVNVKQIKPGPTVTMYGLEPGWNRRYKDIREKDFSGQVKLDSYGRPIVTRIENKTRVKVGSIVAREKDLALSLAAPSIRIQAPVPGESVVGIEVPNSNPSVVTLRSVMQSEKYEKLRAKSQLPIALGKGSGGEVVTTDLTHMPHLLIAGATGSGKSVCINSIISCLLMEKSPEDLRLLLIDPKRVELNPYNGIPHLLRPTVVEADEAVNLLKGLIVEMFRRYKAFEENGSRNILAFNKKTSRKMPYIVVVIDELADLMMTSQYEAENSVCRLAQLGRATGIHLVLATQRPSVNVVTGLIKANFPSRVSFAVASQVDSRTILDSAGADKLLGRGDMLYLPLDGLQPKRTQGVFISDQEIEGLVRYWATVSGPPVGEISLDYEEEEEEEEFPKDQLLDKAIDLANNHSTLSTSLLQRRLRIGYPRAARLMEQLEDEGIVAPGEPGKAREVI